MEDKEVTVNCPFIDMMKEYFPIVPFVVPLVPMLLIVCCLWMYLNRITGSLERQEKLLEQILTAVQRSS